MIWQARGAAGDNPADSKPRGFSTFHGVLVRGIMVHDRHTMKASITAACVFLLCLPLVGAQNRLIYHEQTGQQVARIEVWEERSETSLLLRSVMSNGETYAIRNDLDMATMSFTYRNTDQKTFHTATREGNAIHLECTLKGKPFSNLSRIDADPIYESPERCLQRFAISGSSLSIHFWIVLPAEAQVFQLTAHREGREVVDVAGKRVDAERVKVSLPGIASILWNCLNWYRPTDGTFLRSETVRGICILGTPKTVLELVEGERL